MRRALLVADLAGLASAFALAETVYPADASSGDVLSTIGECIAFAASVPLWIVGAKVYGLYAKDEERADHSTTDDFARMFHLVTVGTFLFFAVARTSHVLTPEFPKLLVFWAAALGLCTGFRAGARAYCRRHILYLQNTIIVGAGVVGQTVARKLLKHPEYGLNLVGFVDDAPLARSTDLQHLAVIGGPEQLLDIVGILDVERVVFAFSNDDHDVTLNLIRRLTRRSDVQVDIVPRFFDVLGAGVDLHAVEGLLMVGLSPSRLSRSSRLVKRLLDLSIAVVALFFLAPVFVAVAILIKLDSPGPAFFRQIRRGEGGAPFAMWKFRTMCADAEARKSELADRNKHLKPGGDPRMFKIDDDPRVTRVGRHLRRLSVDELPQLLNVLLGDMSLVGPRPLIPGEHSHVRDWGRRRLDLKPGITGLWQVLGRDEIGFEEMVRLDYLYVSTWSIGLDLRLLFRTIPVVLRPMNRNSPFSLPAQVPEGPAVAR